MDDNWTRDLDNNTANVNISYFVVVKCFIFQRTTSSVKYLDFIVENMGRFNFAHFQTETFNEQRKGKYELLSFLL